MWNRVYFPCLNDSNRMTNLNKDRLQIAVMTDFDSVFIETKETGVD